MKASLELGKFAGIKVSIHWTFVLLLGWIIYINQRAGADGQQILMAIAFILSIFGCVVLHEFGHALTARRFHIGTKDITLYPIGGVARLNAIPKKPKEELMVALAGPAVNVVIALLLIPFVSLDEVRGSFSLTQISGESFLPSFIGVNVWLAAFNMIPAFPMDGGRVLRALLAFKLTRVKATRIAAGLGQFIALGFMFLGLYGNPFLIIIGLFIFMGAQSESKHAQTEALIEGQVVRNITMSDVPLLSADTLLREAVNQTLNSQRKNFLIVTEGKVVGTLGLTGIIKALRDEGELVEVGNVMDKDVIFLPEDMPIEEAFQKMVDGNKPMAVVMRQEQIVGIVDNDNVAEFVLIQNAREEYKDQH